MIEGQMRAHGEYLLRSIKEQVKETLAPGSERCWLIARVGHGFCRGLGSREWRGTLVRTSNAPHKKRSVQRLTAEGTFERFAGRSPLFLKPCFVHWIDSLFLVRALMLFRTLYRSDTSNFCLVSQFHFARAHQDSFSCIPSPCVTCK